LDVPLIVAAVGLCGVFMGAVAKYAFDRMTEQARAELKYKFDSVSEADKLARNSRMQSYADFLAAAAVVALAQQNGDDERAQAGRSQILDAKARIIIHGSVAVVAALAAFWRAGAVLDNPTSNELYVRMCLAMRRDGLADEATQPSEADVLLLLVGERSDK